MPHARAISPFIKTTIHSFRSTAGSKRRSAFSVVSTHSIAQPPFVLELRDVSLFVGSGESVQSILADVNITFPEQHFGAIIGPSGCGKSTLLKTIAGIANGEEEGTLFWKDRDLAKHDFAPSEIGYVPQFSIAHNELTAAESVESAVRLRLKGAEGGLLQSLVENTLAEVGLLEFADRRVAVLSGGQKRRLALAMEIAAAPSLLLCDEVTSGLDAQAETEIVHLLHALSERDRLVLSVTHSLRHLELYDSILVLYQGVVAYHGSPYHLAHYFQIEHLESLYARLEEREAADWQKSWRKHGGVYIEELIGLATEDDETIYYASASEEQKYAPPLEETASEPSSEQDSEIMEEASEELPGPPDEEMDAAATASRRPELPGAFSQISTLLERRFRIFFRSKGQFYLQIGLIFGFPILVAIFAWNGLPQVQNLSLGLNQDIITQLAEASEFLKQASKVGSLISGIVMFQVILLTLMGANNSGREIAAERLIFEKEKLSGLRPSAYIASKAIFLSTLVLAQSLWMGLFVHYICGFPGLLGAQLLFLILVNGAMTSICLGISSWMASAEQASLVSIYLVGFQLPLSGAVLALPEVIGQMVRPFISAYWSWSGVLQTLRGERYYDIVQMVVQTGLSPAMLCIWVLIIHIALGLFLAWAGCRNSRME